VQWAEDERRTHRSHVVAGELPVVTVEAVLADPPGDVQPIAATLRLQRRREPLRTHFERVDVDPDVVAGGDLDEPLVVDSVGVAVGEPSTDNRVW
jgi:hypothetical protein